MHFHTLEKLVKIYCALLAAAVPVVNAAAVPVVNAAAVPVVIAAAVPVVNAAAVPVVNAVGKYLPVRLLRLAKKEQKR